MDSFPRRHDGSSSFPHLSLSQWMIIGPWLQSTSQEKNERHLQILELKISSPKSLVTASTSKGLSHKSVPPPPPWVWDLQPPSHAPPASCKHEGPTSCKPSFPKLGGCFFPRTSWDLTLIAALDAGRAAGVERGENRHLPGNHIRSGHCRALKPSRTSPIGDGGREGLLLLRVGVMRLSSRPGLGSGSVRSSP